MISNESKYSESKYSESKYDTVHSIKSLTHCAILYVIAVVSNPARFERRYQLFNEFCERMEKEPRVELITVELQQSSRPFVTESKIKIRTDHEIWYKENLINIAATHLPNDWEYMAWIDADIEFHYILLCMWRIRNKVFFNGEKYVTPSKYSAYFHVGYAWAIRRDAYDAIGGLIDFAILGSADNHTALALLGLVDESLNKKLHPNYIKLCKIFQERCAKNIKQNVGYVHGTIMHYFHGNKADRKYQDRWKILVDNQFDPLVDIYKDSNGLWQLDDTKIKLRDSIRRYFRERNEDCNVMPMDYKYCKGKWI